MDFTKKFDCVSRDKLLDKLLSYCVTSVDHRSCGSYLSDRKRILCNNGAQSVQFVVPQCSLIGHVRFLSQSTIWTSWAIFYYFPTKLQSTLVGGPLIRQNLMVFAHFHEQRTGLLKICYVRMSSKNLSRSQLGCKASGFRLLLTQNRIGEATPIMYLVSIPLFCTRSDADKAIPRDCIFVDVPQPYTLRA